MERSVSAADANRKFSELLRGVRNGQRYVVTSHGKPVAKLVPPNVDERAMQFARAVLLGRLQSQNPANARRSRRRWTRAELYEDDK